MERTKWLLKSYREAVEDLALSKNTLEQAHQRDKPFWKREVEYWEKSVKTWERLVLASK